LSRVWRALSDYLDLDSRLLNLFFFAVSGKVSNFATLEICFVVVTLLAFFLRETVLFLSLGLLVFRFVLYLTGYNSVAIPIESSALPFCIRQVGSEIFLLIVPFLKSVIDTCS
jgi:hypothetical protein